MTEYTLQSKIVEIRNDRHGNRCEIVKTGRTRDGIDFFDPIYRVRYEGEFQFWGKVHKNIRTARYAVKTN